MHEVHSYSIDTLREILSKKSGAPEDIISSKLHRHYFQGYFQEIGAKTIVVEEGYTDRDFLEDFAGYYVLCFRPYERKCTRLHFFSTAFGAEQFEELLHGNGSLKPDELQSSYLGFVVVKPLPQTIVGRTCLATYAPEGRRYYPITRDYEVNLFGIALRVKSLAFQEQDHVVAACATSALWSAFHGTGMLFQHPIPSPVEITRAATAHLPLETRALPSDGLTSEQMAHAIRNVGLEPFLVKASNEYVLKSTVYAYLRGRVPMLLGFILQDRSDPAAPVNIGKHAVAITGFSLGKSSSAPIIGTKFFLRASAMDKIYVHDDQVGPFARMEMISGGAAGNYLSTSWKGRDQKIGSVVAIPEILMVPLYHKVRIPFNIVHDSVFSLNDSVIEPLRATGALTLPESLEWDIYLTTVNSLKTDIFESGLLSSEKRYQALTANFPRFLWRATANCQGDTIIDLVFDATDIEQSPFLVYAIAYDCSFFSIIKSFSVGPGLSKESPEWKILEWFSKN
jgi:hypothetical protein